MKRISVALFTGAFIFSSAILPSASFAAEELTPLDEKRPVESVTSELVTEPAPIENEIKAPKETAPKEEASKEETSKTDQVTKPAPSTEGTPIENPAPQQGSAPKNEQEPAEKEKKARLDVELNLIPLNDEQLGLEVYSKIKGVKEAEGTWTIQVNGNEVKSYENEGKEIGDLFPVNNQSHYTVRVTFDGVRGNGKAPSLSETVEVTFPDFHIGVKNADGKTTITGSIGSATDVKGKWKIQVLDEEGNIVAKAKAKKHKGASFAKSFDLKPGNYAAVVIFRGNVDGSFLELIDLVEFKVEGSKKPPVDQPQKPGGDNGKTPEPPVKPSKPDQINLPKSPADSAKQPNGTGGALPHTATTYPTFALMGTLLLLAGFITLIQSRRSTK